MAPDVNFTPKEFRYWVESCAFAVTFVPLWDETAGRSSKWITCGVPSPVLAVELVLFVLPFVFPLVLLFVFPLVLELVRPVVLELDPPPPPHPMMTANVTATKSERLNDRMSADKEFLLMRFPLCDDGEFTFGRGEWRFPSGRPLG